MATAVPKTMATTSAVSYRLVGAQVFGPAPAPVTGEGTFDLRRGWGAAVLHQPSGRQRIILTPRVVYTQVPQSGLAALPRGKTWMSADLTGSESLATNFPQFVIQVEGFNPLLFLDEVAWGSISAAPLGPLSLGSTQAKGYLVTVSLDNALRHAVGASAPSMSLAIRSELVSVGSTSTGAAHAVVTVRLWVDPTGRVVRIQASPPGAGVGVTVITFSGFGVPVQVATPPLAKVADIASLTPSGERENNGHGDSDGA